MEPAALLALGALSKIKAKPCITHMAAVSVHGVSELISGRQRPIDRSTRDAKTFANLSGRQAALGSQRLYPCLEFLGHHCGSAELRAV